MESRPQAARGDLGRRTPLPEEEEESGLLSTVARRVTGALVGTRSFASRLTGRATATAARAFGELRDVGDDILAYLDPGPWLEELYAALGIASTEALGELDERIDEIELKVDDVARRRAREELLLLQERITALEDLLATQGAEVAQPAVERLLERLGQLEERIDALPWRRPAEGRLHPTA
ncbi:MAG: hypothetical protein D6760_12210 [Deltaproteobacteria bacterium]|nr:MAG: hypothetical protein D6760_12210 [Deltaproteobacteria bacterium]